MVVNLQLVGEDAQRLGVARHVCELQLILVAVFERKVRSRLLLGGQSNKRVLVWLMALSSVTEQCLRCEPVQNSSCELGTVLLWNQHASPKKPGYTGPGTWYKLLVPGIVCPKLGQISLLEFGLLVARNFQFSPRASAHLGESSCTSKLLLWVIDAHKLT